MTAIDGIAATGRTASGGCDIDQLLLIATVGAWRTLGELDKLVGSHEFEALRPADYESWCLVRWSIADEMRRLCELLDVLDPDHLLRRPQITDGTTAPVGSPPAAESPAPQPEAPLAGVVL